MHVELATHRVDRLEALRRSTARDDISPVPEDLLHLREVMELHDEIEIIVRACLLPERCIHRPPAVQPYIDRRGLEIADDLDDLLCGHLESWRAPGAGEVAQGAIVA